MDFTSSVAYILVFICLIISSIHYFIIKYIYKGKIIKFNYIRFGMLFGIFIIILANIFFRIPMLFIYIFDEEKNSFAAFLTIVLSIISCLALSFFTYYFTIYCYKLLPSNETFNDFTSLVLSIGFYPIYTIFFFFIDLIYFYYYYGLKFLYFTGKDEENAELTGFHTFTFIIDVISLIICLYNGNVCSWFYMKQKEKKTFIKCLLFPTLITAIPFFALILYKMNLILIVNILMSLIGAGLSIFLRIKVFKEFYKEDIPINISKEEEDDLVEFIDDRICIENFNKELVFKIPNSFSGIIFSYKY